MRKKIAFVMIAMVCTYPGFSQTGTSASRLDSMSAVTIHYLQAKQADSLYALTGANFKSNISAAEFKSIAENQVFPFNDFKKMSFVRTQKGINKYKVEGSTVLQLFIGLDTENKLETLLIQPYSDN